MRHRALVSTAFADRREAGRRLAARLVDAVPEPDAIVLGVPRGGVVVAAEVAAALGITLDVIEVRKIGAPDQSELAVGAVASGGIRVWNRALMERLGLTETALAADVNSAEAEILRRDGVYRGDRAAPDLAGRTVIIIDDGVATGASMEAAVRAVSSCAPRRVVAAVPVASSAAVTAISAHTGDVVVLAGGDALSAVGQAYRDFAQVGDDEVRALLRTAWSRSP